MEVETAVAVNLVLLAASVLLAWLGLTGRLGRRDLRDALARRPLTSGQLAAGIGAFVLWCATPMVGSALDLGPFWILLWAVPVVIALVVWDRWRRMPVRGG